MSTSAEIVNYLTRYYLAAKEESDDNLLNDQINDLVREMGEFLQVRIKEETPHQAIWDAFRRDPNTNAASLIGILEALFEAQPGVKSRIDGYMDGITAIETDQSDQDKLPKNIEETLKNDPDGLITKKENEVGGIAEQPTEKNPPTYLYNNERVGFESDRETPVSEPFMVGENAQIVYVPTENVGFPQMFKHLLKLTELSEDLNEEEKQIVQQNLEIIRSQLSGNKTFNDEIIANALQEIWEDAPSIANALIESLQQNINQLPMETRDFIIQLNSPLY